MNIFYVSSAFVSLFALAALAQEPQAPQQGQLPLLPQAPGCAKGSVPYQSEGFDVCVKEGATEEEKKAEIERARAVLAATQQPPAEHPAPAATVLPGSPGKEQPSPIQGLDVAAFPPPAAETAPIDGPSAAAPSASAANGRKYVPYRREDYVRAYGQAGVGASNTLGLYPNIGLGVDARLWLSRRSDRPIEVKRFLVQPYYNEDTCFRSGRNCEREPYFVTENVDTNSGIDSYLSGQASLEAGVNDTGWPARATAEGMWGYRFVSLPLFRLAVETGPKLEENYNPANGPRYGAIVALGRLNAGFGADDIVVVRAGLALGEVHLPGLHAFGTGLSTDVAVKIAKIGEADCKGDHECVKAGGEVDWYRGYAGRGYSFDAARGKVWFGIPLSKVSRVTGAFGVAGVTNGSSRTDYFTTASYLRSWDIIVPKK